MSDGFHTIFITKCLQSDKLYRASKSAPTKHKLWVRLWLQIKSFFRHWLMRSLRAWTKKKSSPIVSELLAACSCSLTINILNQNWNIQTKFTKYMRSALSSSLSKRCILCWRKNSVHPVRACLAVGVGSGTFHFILPTIPKCFHLLAGGRRHTIGITYILNWIPTYLPTNSPTNQLTNFTQRSPSYATSLF